MLIGLFEQQILEAIHNHDLLLLEHPPRRRSMAVGERTIARNMQAAMGV